jgi:hypothetical protein
MNGVEYLIGNENITSRPLPPFADEICAFLAALSECLLRDEKAKQYGDVISLAFWMRKGNIQKLAERYSDCSSRLGRGMCFHIAPANIPVNFAFSWLFGLLAGNANIVRVPSKPFPQTEIIRDAVLETIDSFPSIKERTAFVTYPANDTITAVFCAHADSRVIWGGDVTVEHIRAFKTKPRCVNVVFPDRWSFCVIDGGAVARSDRRELEKLTQGFYNDTYLMDQNACSSPKLIIWQNADEAVRERFWSAIVTLAKQRYSLQPALAVDKYVKLCEDGIAYGDGMTVKRNGNILYRVEFSSLPDGDLTNLCGKGGYFYECAIEHLEELAPYINEKYQTVTYYGLEPETVRNMVIQNRLSGIDRIVPVGAAMDIGIIWDGYDLIKILSRIVTIR